MDCWACGNELIWGGDHMVDEIDELGNEDFDVVSNFTCNFCGSYVEFYHKKNLPPK